MFNLIRMNLYRMFRTRALIVVSLVAVAWIYIFYTLSYRVDFEQMMQEATAEMEAEQRAEELQQQPEEMQQGTVTSFSEEDSTELNTRVEVRGEVDKQEGAPIFEVVSKEMTGAPFLMVFIIILVSIFSYADEKNGFVKNIVGQCKHRSDVFISKLGAVAIFDFIFILGYFITSVIMSLILSTGQQLLTEYMGDFICGMAIFYLLIVALSSGIVMLTNVSRSGALAMTTGILLLMGFENLIISGIDTWLHTEFYQYSLFRAINMIFEVQTSAELVKTILIGVGFLTVFSVSGTLVAEKRDAV